MSKGGIWGTQALGGQTHPGKHPPQHSSQLGRTPPWRGCNLRTKILSRSSNVFLREGIPPHKALRGLPAPDRTDAGRLNSREVGGLWGLGSQGAGWVQEGGWVVMIPLLLTGTLGQGHADSRGPISVSRIQMAWTGGARACAQTMKPLLGPCSPSCPDADL